MTSPSNAGDELDRVTFAKLANPVKHYLTDKIGIDELSAGLMAANVADAQTAAVKDIIAQQVQKALASLKLPEKVVDNIGSSDNEFNRGFRKGYNHALDEAKAIIHQAIANQGVKEGDV
jgi:hypothetical protein